jgi:FkbM family methyltransferase
VATATQPSAFSVDDGEVGDRSVWTLPRRAVEKAQWEVEKRRIARQRARDHGVPVEPEQPAAHDPLDAKLQLYRQFIRRGDLVFDIGANLGNRVEAFLALEARVVALEPLPDCAAHLRSTFGAKCLVVEKAVGKSSRSATVFTTRQQDGLYTSTMSEQAADAFLQSGRFEGSWDEELQVGVTTLDELIAEHGVPRFTKIDVEGFEPEVLGGLSSPLPALSIEYACELAAHAQECIDHLESLGRYEYAFSYGETMILGPWVAPEPILPWIAARAEHSLDWGDIYARRSAVQ